MTAAELIKKLENDKEYQARIRQRNLEIKEKWDLVAKESESFSKECKQAGYSLETAWDLIMVEEPYPELIPILIKYLEEKNHSPKFREGIARALAVSDSYPYFDRLLKLYYESKEEYETVPWAIACALSAAAVTQEQLDVIEKMIYDKEIGEDRFALLSSIKSMKGNQKQRVLAYAHSDEALKKNLRISMQNNEISSRKRLPVTEWLFSHCII